MKRLPEEDRVAGEIEKDYLESVTATVDATDWRKVATLNDINWQPFDPADRLVEITVISGKITAEEISKVASKYDFIDKYAVEWARAYAANDVTLIDRSTRDAIREIIVRGQLEGITPLEQAKLIKMHIGLDAVSSQALMNFVDQLIDDGYPIDSVHESAEKYAKQLLKARARRIALNETLVASAQGHYLATEDAFKRGVMDKSWVGYRIVTPDERLCPICAEHAGERRELPDGVYASTGNRTPKMHPLCRCVEGFVRR